MNNSVIVGSLLEQSANFLVSLKFLNQISLRVTSRARFAARRAFEAKIPFQQSYVRLEGFPLRIYRSVLKTDGL